MRSPSKNHRPDVSCHHSRLPRSFAPVRCAPSRKDVTTTPLGTTATTRISHRQRRRRRRTCSFLFAAQPKEPSLLLLRIAAILPLFVLLLLLEPSSSTSSSSLTTLPAVMAAAVPNLERSSNTFASLTTRTTKTTTDRMPSPPLLVSTTTTTTTTIRKNSSAHSATLRGGATSASPRATRAALNQKKSTIVVTSPPLRSTTRSTAAAIEQEVATAAAEKEQRHILLWIRLLFLCYYGSLGSLMPYLPVYYDSLGHSGQIIGLLGAVKPMTTFLVAPAWGLVSDAAGEPFTILQLTFGLSLAGQLLVAYSKDANYIMIMVFLTALFNAPVKSLLDSMVMDVLPEAQVADYGRLRLWGQMGFGLGSSGVGLLLSRYSKHVPWPAEHRFSPAFSRRARTVLPAPAVAALEFADKCWQSVSSGYRLLFLVHAALSVPTWFCIQAFRRLDRQKRQRMSSSQQEVGAVDDEDVKKGTTTHRHSIKDRIAAFKASSKKKTAAAATTTASSHKNGGVAEGIILLLHNSDALLFFFLVFVVGTSSGVIENFAYVRMREVGGTGKEMGLSRLVSSLAGAPMFWFSGPLTQALGADKVLVLSLISYVVRFVIYAVMRNPYHGLPAEALRGVTFAAFWSTSTIYAHKVSPPGLHATMLMFLNAMYGGLGQSLGSIIGGKLQWHYGTVMTFWYAAAFDAVLVALVVLYLYVLRDAASNFKDPKPIQARKRHTK